MLKMFLIRHGLTEWNKLNRFQGSSDISLCGEGIEQAMKISNKLKDFNFEAIYSSDLSRAYETAQYVARPHGIEIEKVPEFREIHFGEWEGLTKEEIIELKEFDFIKWKASPHNTEFPGEGNFEEVRRRIEIGTRKILDTNKKGNIVIVSHGGSLKILIMSLLGIDMNAYNKFWLGNTSLSIIEIRKDRIMLNSLNDMNHLQT
jgi:broad specificity phosphatase PhoE